jgi:hypothetical protein
MAYPNGSPLTFTTGPQNVDEILASTMSQYHKSLVDNIYIAIPTLRYLVSKGKKKIKDVGNGVSYIIPVIYKVNSTANSYSNDDILDTTPQNNYTDAQYLWKQYSVSVVVTGLESMMNSGRQAIFNLVKARIDDAEKSGKQKLAQALFNTAPGTKDIIPIYQLVDATSSIADINSSTNPFWQSQVTTSGSFAAQGWADLRHNFNLCSQFDDTDQPDFFVTTQNIYEYYEGTLVVLERYTSTKEADAGIEALKFKGRPFFWDPSCNSGTVYELNSNHLELAIAGSRDWSEGGFVKPTNQDLRVNILYWGGALVSNARRYLGRLNSVTA